MALQGHHRHIGQGRCRRIQPPGLVGDQPQTEAQTQHPRHPHPAHIRQLQAQARQHRRGQGPLGPEISGGDAAQIHPQAEDLPQRQHQQSLGQPVRPAPPALQPRPEDQGGPDGQPHPEQVDGHRRLVAVAEQEKHPAPGDHHRGTGREHQRLPVTDPRVPQQQTHRQPQTHPQHPLPRRRSPEPQIPQAPAQGRRRRVPAAPSRAQEPQGQRLEAPFQTGRRQGEASGEPPGQRRRPPSPIGPDHPVGRPKHQRPRPVFHHMYHCLSLSYDCRKNPTTSPGIMLSERPNSQE